jgi:limonene 1,2-monooxygenase
MRLLRGETVSRQTRTHTLIDARLHLRPYTEPRFEIAVAAVASPAGSRMAGRYGIGLLSIGATLTKAGFDALAHHWNVVQERAEHYGQTVSRRDWRLVGVMHIAETREQAYKDVEYGIETWFRYFQKTAAFPQMAVEGGNLKEMIDFVNEAGIGAIGTVMDARAQVQRLWDQSGGFGCMLLLGHEWANPDATKRSWELISQHVMPHFQGGEISHAQQSLDRAQYAGGKREDYAAQQMQAIATMTERYQQELDAKDGS